MKARRKGINIDAIWRLVIFGAIGIIALAFGWLALNQNTERRSKAALAEKIYKSWEFKGSVEGWVGENSTKIKSSPDALVAIFPGNSVASIRQDNANTALPLGNKYVKVMLSLTPGVDILGVSDESGVGDWSDTSSQEGTAFGSSGDEFIMPEKGPLPTHAPIPTGCQPMPPCVRDGTCLLPPPEDGWCPFPTRPQPGVTMFDLTILYQLTGKTTWEKPVVTTGLSSKGAFAEYAVLLPGISPLTVAKLKLQASNVKTLGTTIITQDYTMLIDRIRLTGPVPPLTPTPTRRPGPQPPRGPTSGVPVLYETPSAQGKHWTCAFFPNGFWCK